MTTEFKIDSDVPLPTLGAGGSGRRSAISVTVEKLQVGQSFFVPRPKDMESETHGISVSGVIGRLRKGLAEKGDVRVFTTRKVTENDVDGVRVWRTK